MTPKDELLRSSSSFRDPSGFVFSLDGNVYRQINESYGDSYDLLLDSGLYRHLVDGGLLVSHEEVTGRFDTGEAAYKVIRPLQVPFVSYPYEWCFSQLKDAAALTLKIQKLALRHGMSLKDASAYNVQFFGCRPVFIDTLSFEKQSGGPWVAYRQFCQHFLAPLALMSYTNVALSQLLRIYIDGVPLDLAARLLPQRTKFNPSFLFHLHLHSRSQRHFAHKSVKPYRKKVSYEAQMGMIENLEKVIGRLRWEHRGTEWSEYYSDTNYSARARNSKKEIVEAFLEKEKPESVWDLGANMGMHSRLAASRGIHTISADNDPAAVEKNYRRCTGEGMEFLLPLLVDVANPSAGIGWENAERSSLSERGPAGMVLALALVHHLAVSNNVPFGRISRFFSTIGRALVVEFIPKTDSQVQRLLTNREDVFPDYSQEVFEREFSRHFSLEEKKNIEDSHRVLYLMHRKDRQ